MSTTDPHDFWNGPRQRYVNLQGQQRCLEARFEVDQVEHAMWVCIACSNASHFRHRILTCCIFSAERGGFRASSIWTIREELVTSLLYSVVRQVTAQ